MIHRPLELRHDGQRFPGVFAAPDGAAAAPVPGILVVHEILGWTDRVRAMPARLAAEGFAALSLDHFVREETPPDGTSLEAVQSYSRRIPDARTTADIAAALALLGALPEVDATRLALLGLSWGGTQSLHANAGGVPVRAVVAFYPKPVYPILLPARPHHLVDAVAEFAAPVAVHFGGRDRSIPPDEVEQMRAALDRRGLPYELQVYDEARHGFLHPAPNRPADAAAAGLAWARTLQFLRRHLA